MPIAKATTAMNRPSRSAGCAAGPTCLNRPRRNFRPTEPTYTTAQDAKPGKFRMT